MKNAVFREKIAQEERSGKGREEGGSPREKPAFPTAGKKMTSDGTVVAWGSVCIHITSLEPNQSHWLETVFLSVALFIFGPSGIDGLLILFRMARGSLFCRMLFAASFH